MQVRDLSQDDRLTLLRLTEQLGQIAERLERLSDPGIAPGKGADGGAFRFESPDLAYNGPGVEDASDRLVRAARPALADRAWCGGLSDSGNCAPGFSTASCSPIRHGTSCSISRRPGSNIRAYPLPLSVSPAASRPLLRCAGSPR